MAAWHANQVTELQAKAKRIVTAQLAVAISICVGLLLFSGIKAASSAFAGGLISASGSLYFARWMSLRGERATPQQMVRAFYVAEVFKILLTAVLFWVAIALLAVEFLPMLLTYAATLVVYWLALLPGTPGAGPQRL